MISFLVPDLRTLVLLATLYESSCLYFSENIDGGVNYYTNVNRIKNEYQKNKEYNSKYSNDLVKNAVKYFPESATTFTANTIFEKKININNSSTNISSIDNNNNTKYLMDKVTFKNNRSDLLNKTTTELPFSIILDTPPLVESSTEFTVKDRRETAGDDDQLNSTDYKDDGGEVWYISAFKFVRRLLIECRTKSVKLDGTEPSLSYLTKMQRCAREKILMALDRASQADELQLSDTVFLVKDEPSLYNVSESALSPSSRESDLQDFTAALCDRVYRLLQSHAVRIKVGDMQTTARHAHYFSKAFPMMVAAFMLMAAFLVPMNFQFLAVLGGKAILLLSQIAIIMALTGKTLNFSGVTDYFKHEVPQWLPQWTFAETHHSPPPEWKAPEPAVHHHELVDNVYFPIRKSGNKPLPVNKAVPVQRFPFPVNKQATAQQFTSNTYQQVANILEKLSD